MEINLLTHLEEQLMRVAWGLNTFFMKDLLEAYPEPKPHHNTISTYLKILTEKNFLSTEKMGRVFRYSVVVSQEAYLNVLVKNITNHYFNTDKEAFTSFLIAQNLVSFKEENAISTEDTVKNEAESPNPISAFIEELTKPKKKKKKSKKKKK